MQIRPTLAWTHPEARGGWHRHLADLTPAFPTDAIAAANATYTAMLDFLRSHPKQAATTPKSWDELVADVTSFVNAKTKDEKQKWFADHLGDIDVDVFSLSDVSLPGTPTAIRRAASFVRPDPKLKRSGRSPAEVVRIARDFFKLWLTEQTIPSALEHVDFSALSKELGPKDIPAEIVKVWCSKFLTMWMVADHGMVESAGHGDPSAKGYSSLPTGPLTQGEFATVAVQAPELTADDVMSVELPGVRAGSAVVVQFSDLKYDAVTIVMDEKGKIVRLLWTVL